MCASLHITSYYTSSATGHCTPEIVNVRHFQQHSGLAPERNPSSADQPVAFLPVPHQDGRLGGAPPGVDRPRCSEGVLGAQVSLPARLLVERHHLRHDPDAGYGLGGHHRTGRHPQRPICL